MSRKKYRCVRSGTVPFNNGVDCTLYSTVLYSGLRPSVLAQDRSETKILVLVSVSVLNAVVLVLVLQICSVVL